MNVAVVVASHNDAAETFSLCFDARTAKVEAGPTPQPGVIISANDEMRLASDGLSAVAAVADSAGKINLYSFKCPV